MGFGDAVKAVTSGVTCPNCSHPHYSRLWYRRRGKKQRKNSALRATAQQTRMEAADRVS